VNKAKNRLQQGFAVVELAIFVVVIVAVSGIGYWAISKSKATTTITSNIASIEPVSGPTGKGVKVIAPQNTIYSGTYQVNTKPVQAALNNSAQHKFFGLSFSFLC
jgi:hypothetical protein